MRLILFLSLFLLPFEILSQSINLNGPFISKILSKYKITGNSEYYINDIRFYKDKIYIVGGHGNNKEMNSDWEKILLEIIDIKNMKSKQFILHDTYLWSGGSPKIVTINDRVKIFWGRYIDDFSYVFDFDTKSEILTKHKIKKKYGSFHFFVHYNTIHIYSNGEYFQLQNNKIVFEDKLFEYVKTPYINKKISSINWNDKITFGDKIIFINNNLVKCTYIKEKNLSKLDEIIVEVYNIDKKEFTHFDNFKILDMSSEIIPDLQFTKMIDYVNNTSSIFACHIEDGKHIVGKIDFNKNGFPIKPSNDKQKEIISIKNNYVYDAKWYSEITSYNLNAGKGLFFGKKIKSINLFGFKNGNNKKAEYFNKEIKIVN